MSDVKMSPEVFLEVAELNRLKRSIKEDGYQFNLKAMVESYGILYNKFLDPQFNYFKVEAGNTSNTIKVNEGFGFDQNGLRIHQKVGADLIPVPSTDIWLWVKISQATSPIEEGTVSIGGLNKSLMTGVGTKFTEILRGQPNFASKIRFTNSENYTLEYEVLEVIDDNNALIQGGTFDIIENNLKFAVVGTFTAGHYPALSDKDIFQYDDCKIEFVPEDTVGQPPLLIDNSEFFLARLKLDSTTGLAIQDKRLLYVMKSRAENIISTVSRINPLIAVENVKKFTNRTQSFFIINFDFKFIVASETRNYQSNLVSVSAGNGGKYKTTADAVTGDFDGWNYYYIDGTYSRILKSIKNSGNIDLYLDDLKEDIVGTFIAPNCSEVEITTIIRDADEATPLYKKTNVFGVTANNPSVMILDDEIFKPSGGQLVELRYKHKMLANTSPEAIFNSTTYYTEEAFNSHGVLTDTTKVLTANSPKVGITL